MTSRRDTRTPDLFETFPDAPPLPPKIAKLVEGAEAVATATDHPQYLPAVLCQVGMPRKKTPGLFFERSSGVASLLIEAGKLYDGRQWIQQPIPYGTKPRLVMFHIATQALKTSSRTIEIGRSIRAFLLQLGINPTGGKRGNYGMFKQQIQALAACRFTLGVPTEDGPITYPNMHLVHKFQAWFTSSDERQEALWPGVLELTEQFYETLKGHAVPHHPEAIARLKDSALDLDVYSWLTARLYRISAPIVLPWSALQIQFGQEYTHGYHFRTKFRHALRHVAAVYPEARFEDLEGDGLRLLPSHPPVRRTRITVQKPGENESYPQPGENESYPR